MQPVSAVIITLNEEHNLRMLLPKLKWCDEIIIVDSGSTDKTVQICKEYRCKVYHRKFDGYGTQKKYAVSLARNSWVLCLDADEILSDKLIEEIKQEMKAPSASGYYIPMTFVFMGKKFHHGKEGWRYFMRLFNKHAGNFSEDLVHEKIELKGETKKMSANIYHYSYRNLSQYFEKFNKYSTYGAELAYKKGKKRSSATIIFAIPLNFFKYYLLERNFLNGMSGFYWSVLNAYYHFAKYIKLREIYMRKAELKKLGIPDSGVLNVYAETVALQPDLSE